MKNKHFRPGYERMYRRKLCILFQLVWQETVGKVLHTCCVEFEKMMQVCKRAIMKRMVFVCNSPGFELLRSRREYEFNFSNQGKLYDDSRSGGAGSS